MSAEYPIRANILLCDFAQVVGGKLYILGGGWNYLRILPGTRSAFMVALDLAVPWAQTNRELTVVVRLVTEDLEDVPQAEGESPFRAEGKLVVGRPPNARAGADLHVPVVIPIPPHELAQGGYVCAVTCDGESIADAAFQVIHLPGQAGGQ